LHNQTVPKEKLYVHTDKEFYLTGELLWFKVYEQRDGASDMFSQVVYVDVLDQNNNAILQAKIDMKAGSGNGSLYVPVTAANGRYKLRAYTSWMKNFGPETFFEKQISIVNPLNAPETEKAEKSKDDLQFFPEGGDLVAGISSKVAFKATDQYGKGINLNGVIVNERNEQVATFETKKFGMGSFQFTPAANSRYKALVTSEGKDLMVKDLPAVKRQGYVLSLRSTTGRLDLQVNTNLADQDGVYLFIHNGKEVTLAERLNLTAGTTTLAIDKKKLRDGISYLTLFNGKGQPVAERLFFKRPERKLTIEAAADLTAYQTRQQVKVKLNALNETGLAQTADLSISIHQLDALQQAEQVDIVSYLWLGSAIKGHLESPTYYFQNEYTETDEALDLLLLTQGWRQFNWEQALAAQKPMFKFLPEYTGHLITGKITNTQGQAVKDKMAYLGVIGERVQFYGAKSDSTGRLIFNTRDFYGPNEVVLQTNNQVDSNLTGSLESPFAEQFNATPLADFSVNPAQLELLQEHSLSMQVRNTFAGEQLRRYYAPGIDSIAFYGKPSKVYKLDDYTRFTTMEEVLREFVPEVSVYRSKRGYQLKVANARRFLDANPLVLLDGVPYFNMDQVMALDPLKIKSMDVIAHKYYWGPTVLEGIIKLNTYKNDLGGMDIDPRAVVLDYEGMQLQREFYSPVYETPDQKNSRIPDFRNVLYWSPNLTTDQQGNGNIAFYTSDQTGHYIGVIEGLSEDGIPGRKVFTFEVKK
ncbi:hypothetical protein, partial [Pedobacter sp.]|uniref:hypothetical protein n=1 Tax=Pedobacter sp. TaxID=1411316 RepID=UPI003D7FD506